MRAAEEQLEQSQAGQVVVVDSRAVVRHGLVTALRVLGQRAVGVTDLREIDTSDDPLAAVIVDGGRAETDLAGLREHIATAFPGTRLLVVTDAAQVAPIDGVELVNRSDGAEGIAAALNDHRGSNGTVRCVGPRPDTLLSDTERAVLRLIARGATAKEAAAALAISPRTVENHKRRIFDRLGASTQAQAVSLAIRSGELSSLEHAS